MSLQLVQHRRVFLGTTLVENKGVQFGIHFLEERRRRLIQVAHKACGNFRCRAASDFPDGIHLGVIADGSRNARSLEMLQDLNGPEEDA